MRRMILALAVGLVVSLTGQPATAATVATPTNVQVLWTTDKTAGIAWSAAPKAHYYTVQASRYKDFRNGDHRINTERNATQATLKYLRPNTKYYFRVAVNDKRGKRIGKWSKPVTYRTA